MKKSIWQKTYKRDAIKSTSLPQKTDILIIGGGITGLSTAYFLRNQKCKVTLIDKGKLFDGITAKTTAKISFLQQDIYEKLKEQHGILVSRAYYDSQKEAIQLLKQIIDENKIDCDLLEVPSYLFAYQEKNRSKVLKEKALLQSFNEPLLEVQDPRVAACFGVTGTYTFHPLKYLNALSQLLKDKIQLIENTLAFQVFQKEDGYHVLTTQGTIIAQKVVFACHYPFFLFPNLIPFKTYLKREYVYTLPFKHEKDYTAINVDKDLVSIRFYKNQILYGTKEHLLTNLSLEEEAFEKGKKDFERKFGNQLTSSFINQDLYSHDYLPLIGRCEKDKNLFMGIAYQAWGMSNGTLAGKIISDLLLGKENPYENLFAPTRRSLTLFLSSLLGSFSYITGYLSPLFSKEKLEKVKINGKMYHVKVDKNGHKYFTETKCPHMKCPLLWNQVDETWDCPCHGSRFDKEGRLLFGPSHRNIGKD